MYVIILSARAVHEFKKGFLWYAKHSNVAADNFRHEMKAAQEQLEQRPKSFAKKSKLLREIHLKKYPFTIVFRVNDDRKEVLITSVFHQSRNPKKKF